MQSDTAQTLLSAWKDQPAVDHHCHPLRRWPLELTALDLRSAFTEALDPEMAERHVIHSSGYQAALHRMSTMAFHRQNPSRCQNSNGATGIAQREIIRLETLAETLVK